MKNSRFMKLVVIVIILLFVGSGFVPSTIGTFEKKTNVTNSNSSGYIQGLIDNATNGDTINIPSGTYYENIIINKKISLIGEDARTTIIDGKKSGNVVRISVDWANISGFTIQNSGDEFYDSGIYLKDYVTDCNITGNIISNNTMGIYLEGSSRNTIKRNNISNNIRGIYIEDTVGSGAEASENNTIYENNFQNNKRHAFLFLFFPKHHSNNWNRNYWNRPRYLLKIIFGLNVYFPWFNVDLHPAKEPYDIMEEYK